MGVLDGPLATAIYKGFKGKLKKGVLRQMQFPDSGAQDDLGDDIDGAPVDYKFEGFTDNYSDFYKAQAGIPDTDLKVCIFAKSMPDHVRPGKDNKARVGTVWYQLRAAKVDPAGALWECQAFEIEAQP